MASQTDLQREEQQGKKQCLKFARCSPEKQQEKFQTKVWQETQEILRWQEVYVDHAWKEVCYAPEEQVLDKYEVEQGRGERCRAKEADQNVRRKLLGAVALSAGKVSLCKKGVLTAMRKIKITNRS